MAVSMVATFEYVEGNGTFIPFTGQRQTDKATDAIKTLAAICDPVARLMLPSGNTGALLANVQTPSFLAPPSLGSLVLQAIGSTMDLAVSKFVSTLVPPTPDQVLTMYRSVSTLNTSKMDLVIPRYVSSMFVNGEG